MGRGLWYEYLLGKRLTLNRVFWSVYIEVFWCKYRLTKVQESRILERNVVCLPKSRRCVAERSSVTFKLPTYYSRGILMEADENDIESKIAVFQDPKCERLIEPDPSRLWWVRRKELKCAWNAYIPLISRVFGAYCKLRTLRAWAIDR